MTETIWSATHVRTINNASHYSISNIYMCIVDKISEGMQGVS